MTQVITLPKKKKKHSRSLFYRIAAWLHLWLGLITGIIVINICITGCIWVFNDEITAMLDPGMNVPWQDKPVITPSQIAALAQQNVPGKKLNSVSYQQGEAATVTFGEGRKTNAQLRIDPYTGQVLRKKEFKEGEVDFFRFILNGHRFLWLPHEIGRPIVNYSVLGFVIILLCGLVLWWPKKWNKSTRKKSFTINWGATKKRVNYDMHNVFGFYAMLFLLAIALTGMVWGIEWYSKGLYWVTSAGTSLPERPKLKSDSLQANRFFSPGQAMDGAWQKVIEKHPDAKGFFYSFPDTSKASSTIGITIYPSKGQFYNSRSYAFDRYTLKELKRDKYFSASFKEANGATKLRRMNYDIHVGSILGLPGKFLAFFASLIGASLPITGFIIWWGKKRKKGKKTVPVKKNTPMQLHQSTVREVEAAIAISSLTD
ncbi:MAG TPA: PepSY-associated TM helix domain-containing protein [Chitinophagaceae bacterium]|nr:PepSY-associated TM helix domain-containing protein [Chitinophagaceae bacterium]